MFPHIFGSKSTPADGSVAVAAPHSAATMIPTELSNAKGVSGDITGRFDPTALERGVVALKQLDSSPNANKAFEALKTQESTRQKELQRDIEVAQAQKAAAGAQKAQVEGEERRKTYSHMQEEDRRTAQYRAQMEAEAYAKKLEDQQRQNEEWLRQQEAQNIRQEDRRRQTELEMEKARRQTEIELRERQAELDRASQAYRIAEETKGRVHQERENVDIRLREMRAKMAEERQTMVTRLSTVGQAFNSFINDKDTLYTFLGATAGLIASFYVTKNATNLAARYVESLINKPTLVGETSRWTWNKGLKSLFFKPKVIEEKIVLPEALSERVQWTTNAIMKARVNGTPFRHLMLSGPPGTGKTLLARTLARNSGMEYAILSGGDIGCLGKHAVPELNKLFKWANTSRNGLILFIDEAEAFLRSRYSSTESMSEDHRNVLSNFLSYTGTESNKFCLVFATNCPEALDAAILDRVDEKFIFPLPELTEREKMIDLFVDRYLKTPTKAGLKMDFDESITADYWKSIAQRTEGFSGRQLAKLVIGFQAAVYGSGAPKLTRGLAEVVLDWHIQGIRQNQHKNMVDLPSL